MENLGQINVEFLHFMTLTPPVGDNFRDEKDGGIFLNIKILWSTKIWGFERKSPNFVPHKYVF